MLHLYDFELPIIDPLHIGMLFPIENGQGKLRNNLVRIPPWGDGANRPKSCIGERCAQRIKANPPSMEIGSGRALNRGAMSF